ncbi:MAG: fatty acyl-AMP ligase [Desulfobacter sp.]|nr:MAG: fatty acyl-AMP ligase [Desulfobacter sp.]
MIHMTIVDFLAERAVRDADNLAFRFMENGDLDGPIKEWSFARLYAFSAGVAQDFTDRGLAGTSVLLAFPPGLDFVKAFYGCLLAGARAVPVPLPNPRSKNPLGRILNTAKVCSASVVLTTKPFADMAKTLGDLPVSFQAVTDDTAADFTGPKPGMEDVAYLQFTSGSTGHPKGVAVSHANAVANLRVMGQMLRLDSTKPAIVWAPHYHDLCLVCDILGPVFFGYESTIMSPMDFLMKPVRWLQAISHYKIANSACPNFGYAYSVRRITAEECRGLDLSSWETAGNGGEPVLPETLAAFNEKFGPLGFRPQAFMPCYGMAESVLFVGGLKPRSQPPKVIALSAEALEDHRVRPIDGDEPGARKVVSCGGPGGGHKIITVDPATLTAAPPNQVGELWIKGPSVPALYWGLKKESEATFGACLADTGEGPFLRTGDLGFVMDGEVYVTGRLKDLIIIAGKNHYPGDIEVTVQNSDAPVRLGACIAVAIPSRDGGEELAVIAEVDDRKIPDHIREGEGQSSAADPFWSSAVRILQGAVSSGHGLSAGTVVFVDPRSLEKTSSGKPRRRYYQERLIRGELAVVYGEGL